MAIHWGWAGSVEGFLGTDIEEWIGALAEHHGFTSGLRPSNFTLQAWREEHAVISAALRHARRSDSRASAWNVVFEFELPLEGGRRPDVVVMAGGSLIVTEFKSAIRPIQADLDQVTAYARDLAEYHAASHGLTILPVLVLPRCATHTTPRDGALIVGEEGLAEVLLSNSAEGSIEMQPWLDAPYEPLPTLVAAARRLFQHERLPHVRRARSAGIPQTVDYIGSLIEQAAARGERYLIMLTGVPGAGKTLVGLRVVYERSTATGQATFLSGNGPLVRVLRDALKSGVFVRDLHAFIKTYGTSNRVPAQHVIVFDEAQRAWDAAYMLEKRSITGSEPDLLIEAASRIPGWAVLVGLVGEGQEIYSGEQAGLGQWGEAVRNHGGGMWEIYCSPRVEGEFASESVTVERRLDLDVSLRSHTAEEIHEWVRRLLEGSISLAAQLASRIENGAFPIYLTRDLDEARAYARRRYEEEPDKIYGLLVSSHSRAVKPLGLDTSFWTMSHLRVERWFNAPREDEASCCALQQPMTEFQCQGLELDLPIVVWGDDFLWIDGAWRLRPKRSKYQQEDPNQLLRNTYRVLLTRGRDGLVVVVPEDSRFDATEGVLREAGLRDLPSEMAIAAEAAVPYEVRPKANGNGRSHP